MTNYTFSLKISYPLSESWDSPNLPLSPLFTAILEAWKWNRKRETMLRLMNAQNTRVYTRLFMDV